MCVVVYYVVLLLWITWACGVLCTMSMISGVVSFAFDSVCDLVECDEMRWELLAQTIVV